MSVTIILGVVTATAVAAGLLPGILKLAREHDIRARLGIIVRRTESGGGRDAWWIIATVLLPLAGAALIASGIYGAETSAHATSAIIFQEIANSGTFLAAAAAWFTATAARRKQKTNPATSSPGSVTPEGMSDNDYRFMQEYMRRVAANQITVEQSDQILKMLRTVKSAGAPPQVSVFLDGPPQHNGHPPLGKSDISALEPPPAPQG